MGKKGDGLIFVETADFCLSPMTTSARGIVEKTTRHLQLSDLDGSRRKLAAEVRTRLAEVELREPLKGLVQ